MEQALELDRLLLIRSEFAGEPDVPQLNWTLLFVPSRGRARGAGCARWLDWSGPASSKLRWSGRADIRPRPTSTGLRRGRLVAIGQWAVAAAPAQIRTLLGSCVGVVLYDRVGQARRRGPRRAARLATGRSTTPASTPTRRSPPDRRPRAPAAAHAAGAPDRQARRRGQHVPGRCARRILAQHRPAEPGGDRGGSWRDLGIPVLARDLGGESGRRLTLDTVSGIVADQGPRRRRLRDLIGRSCQSQRHGHYCGEFTMKRLLVVDDALFMRKLICDVAAEAGWEVVGEAGNGLEAVALYEQLRPDLVTMDLVMPGWAAWRRCGRSAPIDPDARVVVVTALDQKQTLMDSIRDGAIDFIVKPFDRQRVLHSAGQARVKYREAAPCRRLRSRRPRGSGDPD